MYIQCSALSLSKVTRFFLQSPFIFFFTFPLIIPTRSDGESSLEIGFQMLYSKRMTHLSLSPILQRPLP